MYSSFNISSFTWNVSQPRSSICSRLPKAAPQWCPVFPLWRQYFLPPPQMFHFVWFVPQPSRLSLSSCLCHTSHQFPSWSWSSSWIFFMWWINKTIFGLLSSSILTLNVSVFWGLLLRVFPIFLLLCHICNKFPSSSWSSFSMFSMWWIHKIFFGLLKMCDAIKRVRTHTHNVYVNIILYRVFCETCAKLYMAVTVTRLSSSNSDSNHNKLFKKSLEWGCLNVLVIWLHGAESFSRSW